MVRLKTILSCKWLYIIILFFTIIYVYLFICVFPHNSKINPNDSYFKGVITRIKVNGDQLSLELKGIERLVGTYYFKTLEEKKTFVNDYKLGDEVFIKGSFSNPSNNTVPNLFNYKNYLKRRGIYYLISIEQLSKLPKRQDLFYVIKNSIIDRIDMCKKSKAYLRVFILGDNSLLKTDVLNSYRENGVSHLLAISGMHISLLSGIILFLLKRIKISFFIRYVVTIIFFLFYLCLLGFSASVMRAVVLFTLLGINKLLKIGIPSIYLLFLTLCLSLFFNPYFIYDVGFQFSFTVSLSLFLIQDLLKSKKYLQSTLFVSFISFLVSFPISIYYFYQVNIFSVFYNLLFVPFVSIIVFPFALLTFIFPFLDSFLFILLQLMEEVSMYFSSISKTKYDFCIILLYSYNFLSYYEEKKNIFNSFS